MKGNYLNPREREFVENRGGLFLRPFRSYGRIGREEYTYSILIFFSVFLLSKIVTVQSLEFLSVISIVAFIFILQQGRKRCHDFGKTGLLFLIPLFPIALLFIKGDPSNNKYGTPPSRKNNQIDKSATMN